MNHMMNEAEAVAVQAVKSLEDNPRKALKKYMAATGLNAKQMAIALRLPFRAGDVILQRWLTRDPKAKDLEQLVADWFQIEDCKIRATRNLGIVFKVCDHAHERKVINAITSRAGYGKSVALRAYARTRGAIYYAHDKCSGARAVLTALLSAAGAPYSVMGNTGLARKRLVEALVDLGRPLIIIDEADTLPFRSLEILRGVNDEVRGGLILAGMRGHMEQILLRGGYGVRPEQIASRVATVVPLPEPDFEDVAAIAGEYGVRSEAGVKYLMDRAVVLGGYRRVRMLLEDARQVADAAGTRNITMAVLKEAAAYLPAPPAQAV